MRRLEILVGGLAAVVALSGCANFSDREWGYCAVAGGVIGGTIGGVTAGAALNNSGNPSDGERAGAIVGSTIGGAAIERERREITRCPAWSPAAIRARQAGADLAQAADFR